MTAWWIGVIAYLVVVVPIVVWLIVRVIGPARELVRLTDELVEQGRRLPARLQALEDLEDTPDRLYGVRAGLVRYAMALENMHRGSPE